jgi:hypothetical protein
VFTRQNAIAVEVEKVIAALLSTQTQFFRRRRFEGRPRSGGSALDRPVSLVAAPAVALDA